MKRLILVFILIIGTAIAMFTYIRGDYSYDDVTSIIHNIVAKVKNTEQESEPNSDADAIKADGSKASKKEIVLDKRIIPKVQNDGLNKCVNDQQKTVYTQFKCPEGYTVVKDNWAEKANVMNPNEASEKHDKE